MSSVGYHISVLQTHGHCHINTALLHLTELSSERISYETSTISPPFFHILLQSHIYLWSNHILTKWNEVVLWTSIVCAYMNQNTQVSFITYSSTISLEWHLTIVCTSVPKCWWMCLPLTAWHNGNIIQCFRATKMHLSGTGEKGVEWIPLPYNRDPWWVIVKMLMNLWIP
jgi:hypothetical protein